jgi:hypothetical protein
MRPFLSAGGLALLVAVAGCGGEQTPGTTPAHPIASSTPKEKTCTKDSDCTASPQPCLEPKCEAGRCQPSPRSVGFLPPDPVQGDCKRPMCVEGGTLIEGTAPDDIPAAKHECRVASCQQAEPVEAVATGQPCANGGVCARDGSCTRIEQLVVGNRHGCVLVQGGAVRCFGWDEYGQLSGRPATKLVRTAEPVKFILDAVQIAANDTHSCALLRDGAVACWGDAGNARLDFMLHKGSPVIARVERVAEATQIGAAGRMACALHSKGTLACWGDTAARARLVARPRRPVDKLVVGPNGVCCVLDDHSVQCFHTPFEQNPSAGSVIAQAGKLRGVASLSLGSGHGCAVLQTGEVKCWGVDLNGEVDPNAKGSSERIETPLTKIEGLPPARSVATAMRQSCAVLQDDRVACWGLPYHGEGHGKIRVLPLQVRALGLAYEFGCLLGTDGALRCLGDDAFGASSTQPYDPTRPPWPIEL